MDSRENPAPAMPASWRAFDAYSTVTLSLDRNSPRGTAQVTACSTKEIALVSLAGQRFPSWFRGNAVFTITSSTTGAAFLARVSAATATTAQVELLRQT